MASRHISSEYHMIYESPDEESSAKCYRALIVVANVVEENILHQDLKKCWK